MLQFPDVWAFVYQEFAVEPTGQKHSSQNKPEDISSAWAFASEGMQLALTLIVCLFIGYRIDKHFHSIPWFTLGGAVLGIVAGLYGFLKRFLK